MVDWDRVERLRSKGWDWDRIAGDEKVDFHAEEGAGEPGRALRAVYYQRRSRRQRQPGDGSKAGKAGRDTEDHPRWTLARAAYLATPLFGIWFVLAFVFPSPVGVYVSAIPLLAILALASVAVLAFSLLRSAEKWSRVYRNSLAIGLVLGLIVAGGFGLAALSQGCPNLTSAYSSEPQNWNKASNSPWSENGAPVLFFYGAYACPFCSASSWAVYFALHKFGSVSGVQYGHSSSVDTFPNTPEILLDQLSVQSPYVAFQVSENHDPTVTAGVTPGSCTQQAFVSAYDTTGIPFIVLNGQYFHVTSIVPPQNGSSGFSLNSYSAQQIMGEINNQSGPAWDDISPGAYWLTAFMVKVNNGAPANVAAIPQVQQDLGQIS
ncbi:MAG TPA: DUF929 family protein [Thermoplasmata archaeon]|nr:DUF929 family protein [Thermoplasmata archaeon]